MLARSYVLYNSDVTLFKPTKVVLIAN